ncbi:MAG: putative transport system ATP-binding protein [Gaiellaceae bacterium]|jgi:putative ABC transport system ATP-binding protein|nr:putative transport system ATP-binding protein [Gaiellaceae bacterium]
MTNSSAIELRGVSKVYETGGLGRVIALDHVDLTIAGGSSTALVGPSGSGKSTLLHIVGAMDRADSGSVRVAGLDLNSLSVAEQVAYRRTVGFVFQRFHLLPALTALENVAAPLLPYREQKNKFERGLDLLGAVGLEDRATAFPSQLSGGEQQRIAIARALINEPGLLLADEPTGNLDSNTGAEVVELLLSLRGEARVTVLIATHNAQVAARCDKIVQLEDGRIEAPAGRAAL